ncbi:MAG: multimeric flavodoxin WrbA [Arenicella sp.]|jgi:multimeric flavodoxin WrbA
MSSRKLLIIGHAPSPNTQAMTKAILAGAQNEDIDNVEARLVSPFQCHAPDVLSADALILYTTENFAYMSGALKDFFERIYYPCLEQEKRNEAKPYALVIRAGLDGTGTDLAVHKIISGLKWREVQETTLCKGEYDPIFEDRCKELGMTIAASLDNDLY